MADVRTATVRASKGVGFHVTVDDKLVWYRFVPHEDEEGVKAMDAAMESEATRLREGTTP